MRQGTPNELSVPLCATSLTQLWSNETHEMARSNAPGHMPTHPRSMANIGWLFGAEQISDHLGGLQTTAPPQVWQNKVFYMNDMFSPLSGKKSRSIGGCHIIDSQNAEPQLRHSATSTIS